MPDDNDKLNNEAMYGASKSMQVLRSHVGIGSFIECLSAATHTIVQTTSVVTGIKADSRSGVGLSLNTGGGAPSVADLIHSKLDYCNSLFYSINSSQIKRLQTIQNALARAVTKTPKHH